METNDEVVERQKLVPNDLEGEEEINNPSNISQAVKSATNLTSPAVPKMIIKNMSSGETTHSRNSASCSIERTSEKGQLTSAKVTYINERRSRPNLNGNISAGGCSSDDRIAFKSQRKTLKGKYYKFKICMPIYLQPLFRAKCWCAMDSEGCLLTRIFS
uniref:Uncharacterized protein n=1 Tax=Ceratitis capitata TaxID=7213 RepID=W8AUY5_CERCA